MSLIETKIPLGCRRVKITTDGRNVDRFGQKLRALRTYHKMTLAELAQALGHTAHGYISELESGKKTPTVELVLNVSRLFKVTTDQLLKDELELDIPTKPQE